MNITLIGLNHRTAPVSVREQLAFSREGVATALFLFCKHFPNTEAAILSTCNRVEIITVGQADRPAAADIVSFIAEARDVPVRAFEPYLYTYTGEQAVRHLFRVAAGLDSMVIGEYEIVHQMKTAYAQASEQGAVGRVLNRLFHQTFAIGKRARTGTEIGLGKVSVPSVAVDVARGIFSDFSDKRVLVLGAGDVAQLVCRHLRKSDVTDFTVTSRTAANARTLATACEGKTVPWSSVDEVLADADIVIAATSCPKPIITREKLRTALRRRHGRPMFLLDLAVPRNVEPSCEKLRQVYVYDMDTLGRIVERNQMHRVDQIELCEKILDEGIEQFSQWTVERQAQPVLEQMFIDARRLRDAELDRLVRSVPDLSAQQLRAVEEMADRLIGKFMHPCASTVKHCVACEETAKLARTLHEVVNNIDGHPGSGGGNGRPRAER